ncbi:MAG: hypothetical protein ACXAD7_14070, partial [Candidatus Kariarchaeaceae archaeon]
MKKRQLISSLALLFCMVLLGIASSTMVTPVMAFSNNNSDLDEIISQLSTSGFSQEESKNENINDLNRNKAIQQIIDSEKAKMSGSGETIFGTPTLSEDLDLGYLLEDTVSDYRKVYEPWLTKAAIRSMIVSEDQAFVIVGGGYLYDNTLKIYRYNEETNQYDRVWESGDQLIQSDVVSLAFGDTDNNKFHEVFASSADGHVYAFEEAHIFDPKTNMENRFDPVWQSPDLGAQVWGLVLADTDLDNLQDVIAGSFNGKISWFEYDDHSGYPFSEEHWIDYTPRYEATLPNDESITSIASVGDINNNGLPDIVVGTWSGHVYIYENNGTFLLNKEGRPFPVAQDNSYKMIYQNLEQFWMPISKIVMGQLDGDYQKELAFLVPGQGVFSFDYDTETNNYFFNKLTKAPESYELGTGDYLNDVSAGYAVNTYVDWMLPSDPEEGIIAHNVFWENYTQPFGPVLEPYLSWDRGAYPFNTSMAWKPNGDYSEFKPSGIGDNATAIVDFGLRQEVTGDGRYADGQTTKGYDLIFYVSKNTQPQLNQWQIELSPNLVDWTSVKTSEMLLGSSDSLNWEMLIDTDPALNRKSMLEYRYIRMTFFGPGEQHVDSIYSTTLARTLNDATALTIGSVGMTYDYEPFTTIDRLISGTVDGKIFIHEYDSVNGQVNLLWESYSKDFFNLKTNIWDIVQVPNTGTFPTFLGLTYDNATIDFDDSPLPAGYDYVSHSHAHLMAWENLYPYSQRKTDDLIIADWNGTTSFYQYGEAYSSYYTNVFFSNVNDYYPILKDDLGGSMDLRHTFGDVTGDGYSNMMVSTYWDRTTADPSVNIYSTAGIDLWQSGLDFNEKRFKKFEGPVDLIEGETTGLLEIALENSQAPPSAAFADLDGDNDLDLIFSNGRVYVIWNLNDYVLWQFDSNYFEEINYNLGGRLYTTPIPVDMDQDGDTDVVFSYAQTGDKPRYGSTYWENQGNNLEPKWVQRKMFFINPDWETSLKANYTNIQFVYDFQTGQIINMTAFNDRLNAIIGLPADYESHDSFMVATYPLMRRLEINLRSGTFENNFGYRIFETWNSKPELKEWSQTISYSDLDGDGKGEIVVGDYDNNLYVFEYLTSGLNGSVSTYKRAFRSPDLTQMDELTESPYKAEELAGLSGTFYRVLWNHANQLLTGTDLNQNGREEVVVTAGLSIYVFEHSGWADNYELIWQNDLRFSKFVNYLQKFNEITSLGGGMDMDYNNRGEIILGIGPQLIIYEYAGNNDFIEIYAGVLEGDTGRYAQVGNYPYAVSMSNQLFLNLQITAVEVTNIDNNEYQDLIIAGYYTQPWGRKDGYLAVLEHRLGTIVQTYTMYQTQLVDLPISDIAIDDQDYDGKKEIFVGHKRGVDVWEFNSSLTNVDFGDNEFSLIRLTTISSSMTQPLIIPNPINAGLGYIDKIEINAYHHDILTVRYHEGRFEPGDLIEVVAINTRLFMIYSKNDGKTWTPYPDGSNPQALSEGLYSDAAYEGQPSIIQLDDGSIKIAYVKLYFSYVTTNVDIRYQIYVIDFNDFGSNNLETVRLKDTQNEIFLTPTIFKDPTASGGVSVAYIRENDSKIEVMHRPISLISGKWSSDNTPDVVLPFVGDISKDPNVRYSATEIDVVFHERTGKYIMAFAGKKYDEYKPDRDIFIGLATNNSLIFTTTSRVSSFTTDDTRPSISTLLGAQDFTLLLAYEQLGNPGSRIMVTHSKDVGLSWSDPEPLPVKLDRMVNYCVESNQLLIGCFKFIVDPSVPESDVNIAQFDTFYAYDINTIEQDHQWVEKLESFAPAITGRLDGGFAYTFGNNVTIGSIIHFMDIATAVLSNFVGLVATDLIEPEIINPELMEMLGLEFVDIYDPRIDFISKNDLVTDPGFHSDFVILDMKTGDIAQMTDLYGRFYDAGMTGLFSQITQFSFQNTMENTVEALFDLQGAGDIMEFGGMEGFEPIPKITDLINQETTFEVYQGLSSGINPSSDFAQFTNGATISIAVGDSDGDMRREILIASDQGTHLVELQSTSNSSREYKEAWQRLDYEGLRIHDVAMGDTNSNGFDELLIAAEEGNVYVYELIEVDSVKMDLIYITELYTTTLNFPQNVSETRTSNNVMQTVDLNGDEYLDIIYCTTYDPGVEIQKIYAIDGLNGDVLWETSIDGWNSKPTSLELIDLTSDSIFDLIIGFESGVVNALDGSTRVELWAFEDYGTSRPVIKTITKPFLDTSSLSTLIMYSDSVMLTISGGDDNIITPTNGVSDVTAGDIILGNGYYEVFLINYEGLAEIYTFDIYNPSYIMNFTDTYDYRSNFGGSVGIYDIEGDGNPELFVSANNLIFSYNTNGDQLWNTTIPSRVNFQNMQFIQDTNDETLLTMLSLPATVDFESSPTIIGDYYSGVGVNFPDEWRATAVANTYYRPPFEPKTAYVPSPPTGDIRIEFTEPVQYAQFSMTVGGGAQ